MPRFKYRIYFTVEGDEIGVLAIWHPSRIPTRSAAGFNDAPASVSVTSRFVRSSICRIFLRISRGIMADGMPFDLGDDHLYQNLNSPTTSSHIPLRGCLLSCWELVSKRRKTFVADKSGAEQM